MLVSHTELESLFCIWQGGCGGSVLTYLPFHPSAVL